MDAAISEAIDSIKDFMEQTTGERPTDGQIARALKRYFVLKEIKDHIVMEWEDPDWEDDIDGDVDADADN